MRHPRNLLSERIAAQPPKIFVLEVEGEVVGSICAQRILSIDSIKQVTWASEDCIAEASGTTLQLLRVNTFLESAPAAATGLAIGAILRDFCLVYARELGMKKVCAVTKTTDFVPGTGPYATYVEGGVLDGQHPDRGLNFHVSRGAAVVRAIANWRKEDPGNEGHGVLISYNLNEVCHGVCTFSSLF